MDPELLYCAEHSVPPGDVCAIGPFRLDVRVTDRMLNLVSGADRRVQSFSLLCCREKISSYETRVAREHEDQQRVLAEKVLQATWEQLVNQIDSDLQILRTQLPSKKDSDAETALDMKYVHDRQKLLNIFSEFLGPSECQSQCPTIVLSECCLGHVCLRYYFACLGGEKLG